MQKIDLWADDPLRAEDFPEQPVEQSTTTATVATVDPAATPDIADHDYHLRLEDEIFHLWTRYDITQHEDFDNVNNASDTEQRDGLYYTTLRANPYNCFVLVHIFAHQNVDADTTARKRLVWGLQKAGTPYVQLSESKQHIEVSAPNIPLYHNILKSLGGYPSPQRGTTRINMARAMDLHVISENIDSTLPKFRFDDAVLELHTEPIPGYDGTIESLKHISVGELNIIKANVQTRKALSKSKKTLTEKMEDFGLRTLHDLMFWLPRHYIDKTKPQQLFNLIEGESITVIGEIKKSSHLPRNMGVKFDILTQFGEEVPVTFFRQDWLKRQFPEGTEVLVTGKFKLFNRQPQINGASIERSEEAAALPIVPVYSQSEAKHISTNLIMSATREMMSRLGGIKLPEYFSNNDVTPLTYDAALEEIHFPSSLENHQAAMDTLAYYELVYLQLIIQEMREDAIAHPGLPQLPSAKKLQARAIRALPFDLTTSQKKAVLELNQKLADDHPSTTLLNADVGSGKTMVSQLACLQSVDAGHQAAMLAPTDILGQQLYEAMLKLVAPLDDAVRVEYLSSSMKVREKRALLKDLAAGDIDVLIGTHSIISDKVQFKSLGFIAIDEQQKFGAEQRSKLLQARDDDYIPDLLLQTATPIPRSTAQVMYGDMEMIELSEKPPGRKEIITEWIQEDPVEMTEHTTNPVWSDIIAEAEEGHQTFIITPMVSDTGNVDAASVERTYKNLQSGALSTLDIGYTHGKMKQDAQREVMQKFRDGEYDVLIASTVVEVGVDIPNATRVVILSADRLGASSLHQIRGRVGRNSLQSKCYLVSLGNTENSQTRLQSLVDNASGFEVAKADLAIRGEGVLFGTSQSGRSDMIFANLAKNSDMITAAQAEAQRILGSRYRKQALEDSHNKFESGNRLY